MALQKAAVSNSMVRIGGIQKFSTVDYPGLACAAIFTLSCNMRCGYCHNPELVLPEQFAPELPHDEIFAFLEKRVGLLDGVAISGGEPTEHSDLPEFIRRIKAMGFKVKLDSNGTRPDMLRQLIDDRLVDFIAMDIKGPLAKYCEIAARPVDTAAIMQSIALIKTLPEHEFRTTIVRELLTVDDFVKIGEMVQGAKRFALQRFMPGTVISPQFNDATTFDESELKLAQAIMKRYVAECVIH